MHKQRGVITYSASSYSNYFHEEIANFGSCFLLFFFFASFPLLCAFAAVSPFRQRGSKAIFKGWLFNGYRRLAAQVPYWIVPFAIGTHHRRVYLYAN